jgi:predicted DNA binding protein
MDNPSAHAPIGILRLAADGTVEEANDSALRLLERDRGEVAGRTIGEALPKSATGTLHETSVDGLPADETTEEYYPNIDRWLKIDIVRADSSVVIYLRDRTRQHEYTQTIDQLQRRLDRLETIDSLVATVLRKVIDASARDEVWQTVCTRLGTADLYEVTWIGERGFTDGRLQVTASAGDAPDLLETIDSQLQSDGQTPEQSAVENKSTNVVQTIADDESIPRALRVAAFGRGLHSCIAVPIVYDETVYGVMGVYSARKEGFSEQEQASLETLGAIAGFAVNAIRQEDLLFADRITELTLSVRDDSIPFVEVAEEVDTTLSLAGSIVRDDETVVCYLRIETAPEEVADTLSANPAVSAVRSIRERDGPPLLEVGVTGTTPVTTLVNWGATVKSATYTSTNAELVAHVPTDSDIREAVELVTDRFADTDVVSKIDKAREPETVQRFQDDFAESLTAKQRRVLRTAYLADYFNSPRGSTSEEVAEALDISGPTVLYHLRRAQRKLLEAFFEDAGSDPAGTDPS